MRSVFFHLFTHADIRPGQLAELKAAGDPGKDPVLISVPAIFQRKIRGDDHRLFAQQAFIDAGKKVGKRERRRDLGAEIIYDQKVALKKVAVKSGHLFLVLEPESVPGKHIKEAGRAEIDHGAAHIQTFPGNTVGKKCLARSHCTIKEQVLVDGFEI